LPPDVPVIEQKIAELVELVNPALQTRPPGVDVTVEQQDADGGLDALVTGVALHTFTMLLFCR
jgi:hypothetical protein